MVIANEARSAPLAIIVSYPTSASANVVLYKTSTKYGKFFPTLFVKTTDFQLVLFLILSRRVQLPYNGSYIMMAKPIRALELQYSVIQFLIIICIFGSTGSAHARAHLS